MCFHACQSFGESFFVPFSIIRFQLNHCLDLSTSYNDVFVVSFMRFYGVA